MRIYTGGGDSGETGLFGGGRVAKDDPRVEAYGTIDELNASIGLARSYGLPADLDRIMHRIQEELFVLGADLATPPDTGVRPDRLVRIDADAVKALEGDIDRCEDELPALQTFILPGGASAGAALHLARTVSRRAERRLVSLAQQSPVSAEAVPYLNRLSDLLFVIARLANMRAGVSESPWTP